jgi:hypothetical protein
MRLRASNILNLPTDDDDDAVDVTLRDRELQQTYL